MNYIDGAAAQFGSPKMQSSNPNASRNRSVVIYYKTNRQTSGPTLRHGAIYRLTIYSV